MEKPILFSTPMVQEILAGNKTQTRRVIKTPRNKQATGFIISSNKDGSNKRPIAIDEDDRMLEGNGVNMVCPYGQVGDILWVRETWCHAIDEPVEYLYRATHEGAWDSETGGSPWKPSIHMPRKACRLFLEITNVRVERLQDISREDIRSEGVMLPVSPRFTPQENGLSELHQEWKCLWESINGKESWESNPWVWVIEFKKKKGHNI